MPDPIPVSAFDLRQAMRDPRYWQSGHPERREYNAWVEGAFRQLHEGESGSDGLVWVEPYTRRQDGETVEVSGHFRHTGGPGGRSNPGGNAARGAVSMEGEPGRGVERRTTVRDPSGSLIGRCETLSDGSQICTMAMPDGGIVVQGLQPGEGEFIPVAAPAATYAFPALLGAATGLYNSLPNRPLTVPPDGSAADTPFLYFYRGFEGTEAGVRVTVGQLSEQRVRDFCPKTTEFEERLTEIVEGIPRARLSPQRWGTEVHTEMHRRLRREYGPTSRVVMSELSLIGGRVKTYGTAGTTRLDVYHLVEGTDTICAYDIKTGTTGLSVMQATRIYGEAREFAGRSGVTNPRVLIIELRRTP